jgi:iron-sulfur cluster repair protein YtfE (RIC family)
MSSLAQLRNEHAELVRIVKQLEELISGDAPPPSLSLFEVRRKLSSVLIAHLKAEDWVLYPPLLSSPDAQVAETARQFVDEMGGLAQAFTVYVERWDALSIESDWPRYQRESRGIIEALTTRIVRENQELYPLLEKIDRAA